MQQHWCCCWLAALFEFRVAILQGFTAYQTDWSIAAVTLRVKSLATDAAEEPAPFNLPVANMEGQPGTLLWYVYQPNSDLQIGERKLASAKQSS